MTPYLWALTVPLAGVALGVHLRLRRGAAQHEQRFDRIEKKLEELKIQADQNRWESDKRHRRNEQALTQLTQRSGTA
jgi:hypothetical protein